MSNPNQTAPAPTGGIQSPLSNGPASPDLAAESKKWESRCAELTAERDKLRDELAKIQKERDQYLKSLYHLLCKDYTPPPFTKEEAFAHLDDKPTFAELIAELDREYAQEK